MLGINGSSPAGMQNNPALGQAIQQLRSDQRIIAQGVGFPPESSNGGFNSSLNGSNSNNSFSSGIGSMPPNFPGSTTFDSNNATTAGGFSGQQTGGPGQGHRQWSQALELYLQSNPQFQSFSQILTQDKQAVMAAKQDNGNGSGQMPCTTGQS